MYDPTRPPAAPGTVSVTAAPTAPAVPTPGARPTAPMPPTPSVATASKPTVLPQQASATAPAYGVLGGSPSGGNAGLILPQMPQAAPRPPVNPATEALLAARRQGPAQPPAPPRTLPPHPGGGLPGQRTGWDGATRPPGQAHGFGGAKRPEQTEEQRIWNEMDRPGQAQRPATAGRPAGMDAWLQARPTQNPPVGDPDAMKQWVASIQQWANSFPR